MNRLLSTAFVLACTLLVSSASATIRNVPADFGSIQAGISASRSGDTVLVHPRVYREHLLIENRNIVIASLLLTTGDQRYIDSTIIDGNGNGTVVEFAGNGDTTSLRGFTIRNGHAQMGGGIYCHNNSNISIEDAVITQHTAETDGGGVYVIGSILRMKRVTVSNNHAVNGGGLHIRSDARLVFEDGIVRGNVADNTGGIYFSRSEGLLTRVAIVQNTTHNIFGAIYTFDPVGGEALILQNVTVANNVTEREGTAGGLSIVTPTFNCRIHITNSIFWGDSNIEIMASQNPPANLLTVDYTDVEGGRNGIEPANGNGVVIGEGLINIEPLFADAENGDFHLQLESPCIDSGDPNAPLDEDGTRADLGAYPANQRYFYLGGYVLNSSNDMGIADAEIFGTTGHGFIFNTTTDSTGHWGRWYVIAADTDQVNLRVSARGYLPNHSVVEVRRDDSTSVVTHLDFALFSISEDTLAVTVDSGATRTIGISIVNDGNGPLHWNARARSAGDAGFDPLVLRKELAAETSTGDNRLEGVVFDGENYFVSGANGEDSSMIYILDREGVTVSSFLQMSHSRYGMKDLDWDGELIWGSGDTLVYGFNREGDLIRSWPTILNPANAVACDTEHDLIYLCGTTTNILAYDRDGNVRNTLNRKGLRMYGLSYYADDPDGYNLYILFNQGNNVASGMMKMNTLTGDTIRVTNFNLPEAATGVGGGFICNNFDRYQSAVVMYIPNVPTGNGGDMIHVYQLKPNNEWLTLDPTSGDVQAGQQAEIDVIIKTAAEDNDWVFNVGDYEGTITIQHDGQGNQIVIPVYVTVSEPNGITALDPVKPVNFGITGTYPTPFNSTLTISYHLEHAGLTKLSLIDMLGREMYVFDEGFRTAGDRRVSLELTGLPSGVYYMALKSEGVTQVAKVVCLK